MLFMLRREKWMEKMMTVASDAREQFLISFDADAVAGQGEVCMIS